MERRRARKKEKGEERKGGEKEPSAVTVSEREVTPDPSCILVCVPHRSVGASPSHRRDSNDSVGPSVRAQRGRSLRAGE